MNKPLGKPTIILLIDDDEDDRDMFCEALHLVDGHAKCMMAVDGIEALQMLRDQQKGLPDFIFLDLNMPRMDGKQCLVELRKISHLQDIPIIIYTTSKHPRDMEETKQLGAAHFISKPFHFDDICKSITYVLAEEWKVKAIRS